MNRWLRRLLPWGAALLVGGVACWSASLCISVQPRTSVRQWGLADRGGPASGAPAPIWVGDPVACRQSAALSGRAAALVGYLALLEADQRPIYAARAAPEIRALASQARVTDLTPVLDNLAGALERYAGGDATALRDLRAASARNAHLRERFTYCGSITSQKTSEVTVDPPRLSSNPREPRFSPREAGF